MARKEEMYLIIDTETCNSIEQPMPYAIGYAIADRHGNIYLEKSIVVAEMFLDRQDLMQSAYFAEKVPQYWEDIKNEKRIVKTLWNIRKELHNDMKEYGVKKVGAYNMGFDKRVLNNITRYATKSFVRWFFPFGTEYFCIWNMACQTILNTKSYVTFAKQNGLETECGNILTNAECCYKFLEKNLDFKEEHTGLEDVEIKVKIMAKCFSTHKEMDEGIYSGCWRLPQRKAKELELREVFK